MLARKEDQTFTHRFFLTGIARKNGKTALASTLPLFFGLYGDRGGEIYSAAADRDQGAEVARCLFGHPHQIAGHGRRRGER